MDPTGIVTFRQGDVGEYLREVWVSISDEMLLLTLCARRTLFSLPSFPVERTAFWKSDSEFQRYPWLKVR
jgi:hypothetical protein